MEVEARTHSTGTMIILSTTFWAGWGPCQVTNQQISRLILPSSALTEHGCYVFQMRLGTFWNTDVEISGTSDHTAGKNHLLDRRWCLSTSQTSSWVLS